MPPPPTPYRPRRPATQRRLRLRGFEHQLNVWGDPAAATAQRPLRVLLHGWMDVGASFQFVVDAMADDVVAVAPDWRGFGGTEAPPADAYWFPDYLGDLDALLDALSPDRAVDLVGHSMGGNVAMQYAGVRPDRVRRLANLEGFGLPATPAEEAPARLQRWLDELKTPQSLKDYDDLPAVAARLRKTHPRLAADQALWLASQWAAPAAGRWRLRADPAHKRINPVPYWTEAMLACWRRIAAPVLWIEGDLTEIPARWGTRYTRAEFEARLAVVPQLRRATLSPAGHMLHHEQPQALAALLDDFFG